jgi:glycine cleavage system aminomethyltransferase T/glycine/D-amino acid oxidase-like deaminating enzyme
MPTSSEAYSSIIIGGGAIGLSIAYHLAQRGAKKILLLERHQLTSGTSWHAAGIVGPLRATPNMTRLATYATHLFPRLEEETGQATGYRRTGGYWLARDPNRHDEFHRIAAVGEHVGLHPQMIDNARLKTELPCLNTDGITLTMAVPEDGSVNPVDLCMAYAKAAKQKGVEIREGARVVRLVKTGDRVTGVEMEDSTMIHAETVILAAGAWSKPLAASAGLMLPLQAVEHMYIVTEPKDDFQHFPVLRDLDRGFYVKGDAGKLLIGVFEPDATCWDAYGPQGDIPFLEMAENWDWFTPYMEAALDLIPALAETGIQFYMNGPESFTVDSRPLIGPAPEQDGLYVAAGMNSLGIMSSAGVGKTLSEWILDGAPEEDAWEVDLSRADPLAASDAHMVDRMGEAVSAIMDIHWPYKQPLYGRDLRRSALHDCWAKDGAHFGVTASWERPLWFAQNEHEQNLPYKTGPQPWWVIAEREAAAMDHGAVLLDLSPFTKIDLSGDEALASLQYLACANLDRPLGRAVYTPLLNPDGGIEADVTITRRGETEFRLTSGAATRWRDRGWLRRNLDDDVIIKDVTEDFAVIGVMGAASRSLLQSLDPHWQGGRFATVSVITLHGVPCQAMRLSFVGELGWEIEIPKDEAAGVYKILRAAGASPMGHYALDGCRLEKGFLHWGHDLGPTITPLAAGLGFTIDWTKTFQGKAALENQRDHGLDHEMIMLDVEDAPLLLHDEPVVENGRVIGFTTSGGYGPRTGRHLAFAYVETSPMDKTERCFQVKVGDRFHDAKALTQCVFDPTGERMRS